MTAPDLIHIWPRAGDPNSGQWVGVTAPQTTMSFTTDGPTLTAVRALLDEAERKMAAKATAGEAHAAICRAMKLLGP